MFRLDLGSAGRYCDGLNRRSFLQLGVAGMASLGLPQLARAKEESGSKKNTSVILIWLDGGPGHMDMYDMKPDAPAEYRGIWKPIRTKVPGFDITELFPKQAQVTDKFSIVRSLHHDTGDHFAGGHRMLTTKDMGVSGANSDQKFPGIGAIVAREVGPRRRGHAGLRRRAARRQHRPDARLLRRPHARRPVQPVPDRRRSERADFQVQNLNLAQGLTLEQLEDRRSLAASTSTPPAGSIDGLAEVEAMDRFSAGGVRVRQRPSGAAGVRHQQGRPETRATGTAGTTGARARCWPGGWSRPARPSSRSTSAAGTITGT